MAIATEIGRLQGAKQDLISRLKAKGVTVPNDATLEEITPLVDNISGSGGSGGASVETCTVTLTADESVLLYGVTRYVDGILMCESDKGYGEQEFTFDNVVKGSCLTVVFLGLDASSLTVTNCELKAIYIEDFAVTCTACYEVS